MRTVGRNKLKRVGRVQRNEIPPLCPYWTDSLRLDILPTVSTVYRICTHYIYMYVMYVCISLLQTSYAAHKHPAYAITAPVERIYLIFSRQRMREWATLSSWRRRRRAKSGSGTGIRHTPHTGHTHTRGLNGNSLVRIVWPEPNFLKSSRAHFWTSFCRWTHTMCISSSTRRNGTHGKVAISFARFPLLPHRIHENEFINIPDRVTKSSGFAHMFCVRAFSSYVSWRPHYARERLVVALRTGAPTHKPTLNRP